MAKGNIGVTTENIFPVIKKFLYSDHEIFLRELVSNAIDASQKLKTLAACGEFDGDTSNLAVRVIVDKENGTLTVSDNGIGMTAEDIDKYINQIAFSGAEEFLKKYKDVANSIIGHFGLGFYSAFMVSKKVEIRTLSHKAGAKAMSWVCDGSPSYEMNEIEKETRGTDIILTIDDDSKEFLEKSKIDSMLKKYCRFLPVPVISGKEQEWKDGKYVDTDKDNVINSVAPLWARKPSELKDEDYLSFYHEIMPGQDDPLFWIHLNVDYPFTLTGILYFPKIKNNFDINRKRISLYCNQVYVTDEVDGVVPEFLTLLQGVIDSPDIPLNVSRSYLQSDGNVKKIASHITKKVASRLDDIAKNSPQEFEEKWNDVKVFIQYGMLTDEKFCDSAMKFSLLENTDGKFFKIEDYKTLIQANQTDKDGNLIFLYAPNKEEHYTYINAAKERGYDVLLMNGQLDSHIIGMLESKIEKARFVRADSDIIDNLIKKEDAKADELTPLQREMLTTLFRSQVPQLENSEFMVAFQPMAETGKPIVLTQSEYMRRMKEMAEMQPGMAGIYGNLPNSYNLTLNTNHPVVKSILSTAQQEIGTTVEEIDSRLVATNAQISAINSMKENDKELSEENKTKLSELEAEAANIRKEQADCLTSYASTQDRIKQLVDIALLGYGLLKGEALDNFLNRSINLLK